MTYNLGMFKPSNKKADQGSAVHKVLEWLAIAKQQIQEGASVLNLDGVEYDIDDFVTQHNLTDVEVDEVNTSRIAKSIYKTDASIKYGHTRKGVKLVTDLVRRSCDYYAAKCVEPWTRANYRDCTNWTWMALDYKDGMFDPRLRTIKCPEQHFDLPIEYDWAQYDFKINGQENLKGQFAIKGTVDLITELSPDTLEIVDWKTGQRLNWATGEEKTYAALCKDVQLMMYYYAVSRLFPEYKNILLTIFFIRDGGPYTMSFGPSDIALVEEKLREHFEEVKANQKPSLCSPNQTDFKCTKLCSYYKELWPGTSKNQCRFIQQEIANIGMDAVIEKYKNPDFEFGQYQSPGS